MVRSSPEVLHSGAVMNNLNIGVRGRLLLAFLGMSALVVLGALAAFLTFSEVGGVVDRIVSERVPATMAALALSRQAERIALLAPRIVADETMVDQFQTDRIIRTQIGNLDRLLAQVKASQSNGPLIEEVENAVTEIRKTLGALQFFRVDTSHYGPPRTGKPVDPFRQEARGILLPPSRAEMLAQGQKMIQSNIESAGRLAAAVDRLVADQTTKIDEAKGTIAATQHRGVVVLLGVVALSLVSSVLIVWLYVGRSIIGRLTALSGSMLAIASGNLTTPVPEDGGQDEIGRMADALRIFQGKAHENERLHRLKGFLPPQVAELIVNSGDESVLESHRRDVAVLFCDLRGFTTFAETTEPEEIMEFLREYHASLGQLVDKFAGTLERFTGDGLIVLFNDPLPIPDCCLAAAKLAVEMRAAVNQIVQRRRQFGNQLGFGVGIAYGYATLGRVGFKGRFDYTAIGSVVNLAARLCERAKASEILVDGKVCAFIRGHLQVEALGEYLPKGFSKPVQVFNITEQKSEPSSLA